MGDHNFKLEQLFNRCDTRGTGFIGQKEFRDLCSGFDIDSEDADIIFVDLDHDGDGKIIFDDFAFGFRDFITPGARRGSIQLGLGTASGGQMSPGVMRQPSIRFSNYDSGGNPAAFSEELELRDEDAEKQREMERKHQQAQQAWRNFADHLGKDDIKKFLGVR